MGNVKDMQFENIRKTGSMGNIKKYEIGKYRENWKYGNFENTKWKNIKKIGNMKFKKNMKLEIWKIWKM